MAEYRIVAKLDPQTGAGTQKVKQDLRGIQTEAKATETALNRSFDQAKFDRTIGGLVGRINQLDKSISGLAGANGNLAKSNDSLGLSLDKVAAAALRGAGATDKLGNETDDTAGKQARLEAALRRVLNATDATAAEQQRLNMLLADAKRLLDAGMISQERYVQVQRLATQSAKEQAVVTGSQRIGFQQLGFQLGDMATMYSLGAKPAQIFASQIGQVSQALMLMGGNGGTSMLARVAGFLGGPWGIALTLGVTLLGPFVAKLWEGNDALKDAVDKKKKDAKETEITRQAHERWSNTLDGLISRQRGLADAMRDRLKVQGLSEQADLNAASRDRATLEQGVADGQRKVALLREQLARASAPVAGAGTTAGIAAQGIQAANLARIRAEIKTAEGEVARLQGAVRDATTRVTASQILVGEQQGRAMVDLSAAATGWGDRYTAALRGILQRNDQLRAQTPTITAGFEAVRMAVDKAAGAGVNFKTTIGRTRELGIALEAGKISAADYRTEMGKFAAGLNAAAEAAEKASRRVSDGVARFTTAKQAIGIAGRELQQSGLKVSENEQFGGTKGRHTGAGHRENRAIDVDIAGASDGQKTPEDIRSKYDGLARRYAARGYIVLWAGKRYDPSGRISNIPAGDHQHYGHMHLEAPQTIVGKATGSSTEAQERREDNQEARVAERAEDFIAGAVNQAATRGLPANSQSQLNGAIDEALAEFKRRFDREATTGEKAQLTKAFTDADARETALRFETAYVDPLKRLQDLQGKVGIDRAVLNAQLDESARLGRALTPVEAKMIENGIRNSDQLQRQAQLLEQIKGPMQAYTDMVATLNALLAKGEISQAAYNARLAEMNNQAVQTSLQGMEGVDPASGRPYEDVAAISDENARYAQQLADLQTYRQQIIDAGLSYDALELAAAQQHQANLAKVDQARRDVALNAVQDMAGSMTSIMKSMFGEQSRMYKAAFAMEKAVAIARSVMAIQTGIAQAAALPFPANLPAIASVIAATASIVSNIQAVALNFKDGGYVNGRGGPRSDSVPANLSNGEFVVNARATAGNRALLEAINDGRQVRRQGQARAAETARVVSAAAPPVSVQAAPAEVRVINVTDPRAALQALNTSEGVQTVMNILEQNPHTVRRLLGAS